MSMSAWDDTSTSTTTVYYSESSTRPRMSTGRKKTNPWKFHSKFLEKVSKVSGLEGAVAVFAYRRSPAFKDRGGLELKGMNTYYNDPVLVGYDAPTRLAAYNFAIVIDALEYISGKMPKANMIKEAMATLKPKSYNPYVLITTKTPKMVEELAKNDEYEKTNNGFLIPKKDKVFGGLVIQGLDANDLIDIAYFAGAKYIEEDILIETDRACIRIYLHKQG